MNRCSSPTSSYASRSAAAHGRFAGVDLAAGKGDLARMGAQIRRPQRQQNGEALRPRDDRHEHRGGTRARERGRVRRGRPSRKSLAVGAVEARNPRRERRLKLPARQRSQTTRGRGVASTFVKAPRSRSPAHREERPRRSARRTSPFAPRSTSGQLDKIVEQRPLHQRPEVAAHLHVGLEALRGAALEPKGCSASAAHHVFDIGAEGQNRLAVPRLRPHLDRQERRVVDPDPDLLDRRHQNVTVAFLAHNRGEQLDQRRPADRRATIKPCSIGSDAHVDIAAVRRIPQMHRRRAAAAACACRPRRAPRSLLRRVAQALRYSRACLWANLTSGSAWPCAGRRAFNLVRQDKTKPAGGSWRRRTTG